MRHVVFAENQEAYKVAILVPVIRTDEILKEYIAPFDLEPSDVAILNLHWRKGVPAKEAKAYIEEELVPALTDIGATHIICANAEYFKILTKQSKAEPHLGYVMDSVYGPWKVVYVNDYRTVFTNPAHVRSRISLGIKALTNDMTGDYQAPGTNIIKFAAYPKTDKDIEQWLERLLEMDCPLAIDIEGFGLRHYTAGIGTIAFAWSKHEGIAFPVDYVAIEGAMKIPFARRERNSHRRMLLRSFFQRLLKRAVYHNIGYDVTVLIYQLYMDHLLDTEGLLHGLDVMCRNWDCTRLISYLATNSCAGNNNSLKHQAHEFAGNYAQDEDDIKDIRRIPEQQLLEYNLVDAMSTFYVLEKHWPTVVRDQQQQVYTDLFQPAMIDIIQMQLTGMPVNMTQVGVVKEALELLQKDANDRMRSTRTVLNFTQMHHASVAEKETAKLKKKIRTAEDVRNRGEDEFNPNSPNQLVMLLYEMIGLPVISYTKTKQPSADGDTLEALQNHTTDPDVLTFLKALMDFKSVNKLLTDFIPSLEGAALAGDGWHYLFGSFNLGGTLSGRLSSSAPNLQNLPSNVTMMLTQALQLMLEGTAIAQFIDKGELHLGKLIKSCFEAPPGWLFAGADFSSLEDKISAVTTKDPNKIKVYTDGYDGHSLRTFAYFREKMPDIVDTVESINSIQKKYKGLRYDSKAPTFALTYQGTFTTLMKNCGFSEEQAKDIERRYHDLYWVSDKWVADRLEEAGQLGYIVGAFGLRVRTPLLAQTIRGNNRTPREAQAEGRSAGNALGQSWCLLNSRAGSELMGKVRRSKHRLDIRPSAHIHDAQYFLIRDDMATVGYLNEHLIKAMEWQEHPLIRDDDVKLGGELGVFHPNWSQEITIPNGVCDEVAIEAAIDKALAKIEKAKTTNPA